jgi:hypothetical protein
MFSYEYDRWISEIKNLDSRIKQQKRVLAFIYNICNSECIEIVKGIFGNEVNRDSMLAVYIDKCDQIGIGYRVNIDDYEEFIECLETYVKAINWRILFSGVR